MMFKISTPSIENALWLALAVIPSWYIVSALTAWYRHRNIPGPFLASFSYIWLGWIAMSGRQEEIYRDINKKYGPLVRVGPNELLTDDPNVIRRTGSARGNYGKDQWYMSARFNPYQEVMHSTVDDKLHDRMKAQAAAAYSGRDVGSLETCVDDQLNALLELIRSKYASCPGNETPPLLELGSATSYLTVDIITRAALGKEFGYLKTDSDAYGFLDHVRSHLAVLPCFLDMPYLRNIAFSKTSLRLFGPKVTDKKGVGRIMGVAAQHMSERFSVDEKPQADMLGSFIKHGMSQQECEAEGLFALIAGSETTASVIRVTMLCLMSSPLIYQKFKSMIKEAIDRGAVSSPITFAEARRLPYLQAIIYEGMRIRAPATGLYPKTVPQGGETILGYSVPAGTAIGMNTPAMMKASPVFGRDVDIFRPERFLEVNDSVRTQMEHEVEMVFGHGRYMCAGKPLAFIELSKAFFELMRHFDFQIANPTKPWVSKSYNVFVEEDYYVKVTKSTLA